MMTKMFERAVEKARKLSDAQQDEVAALILTEIEDEAQWEALVASERSQEWLRAKAGAVRNAARDDEYERLIS